MVSTRPLFPSLDQRPVRDLLQRLHYLALGLVYHRIGGSVVSLKDTIDTHNVKHQDAFLIKTRERGHFASTGLCWWGWYQIRSVAVPFILAILPISSHAYTGLSN
jgi:hypothetical protein